MSMATGKHWKFILILTKTSSKPFIEPQFNRFFLHLSEWPGFTTKVSAHPEVVERVLWKLTILTGGNLNTDIHPGLKVYGKCLYPPTSGS